MMGGLNLNENFNKNVNQNYNDFGNQSQFVNLNVSYSDMNPNFNNTNSNMMTNNTSMKKSQMDYFNYQGGGNNVNSYMKQQNNEYLIIFI